MHKLAWIMLMGGVGSVARYLVGGWVQRSTGKLFPLGTLVVNVVGCLLIGILAAAFGARLIREEHRMALMVGFLGGFTTFSSFGLETFNLLNDGEIGWAVLNIGASVVAGLIAVWIGYRVTVHFVGV
jgi:CrcB protein